MPAPKVVLHLCSFLQRPLTSLQDSCNNVIFLDDQLLISPKPWLSGRLWKQTKQSNMLVRVGGWGVLEGDGNG
jgi:hypothetical protein